MLPDPLVPELPRPAVELPATAPVVALPPPIAEPVEPLVPAKAPPLVVPPPAVEPVEPLVPAQELPLVVPPPVAEPVELPVPADEVEAPPDELPAVFPTPDVTAGLSSTEVKQQPAPPSASMATVEASSHFMDAPLSCWIL